MQEKTYILPDWAYTALKWLAALVLPALSTLLLGIGKVWGIGVMDPVAQTVTLVGTFLGAVLGVSAATAKPAPRDGE